MRSQRDKIDKKITCPFVFVYIDRKNEISYYVLSQKQLIQVIEKTDYEYYNRPRKEPLKDYPIAITLKDIADYKDKWDNLWI